MRRPGSKSESVAMVRLLTIVSCACSTAAVFAQSPTIKNPETKVPAPTSSGPPTQTEEEKQAEYLALKYPIRKEYRHKYQIRGGSERASSTKKTWGTITLEHLKPVCRSELGVEQSAAITIKEDR